MVGFFVSLCAFFFVVFGGDGSVQGYGCMDPVVGLWCGATVLTWVCSSRAISSILVFSGLGVRLGYDDGQFPGLCAMLQKIRDLRLCRSRRALEPVRAELTTRHGVVGHSRPSELGSHQMAHAGMAAQLEICPLSRLSRPHGLHYSFRAVYCSIPFRHVLTLAVHTTMALGPS